MRVRVPPRARERQESPAFHSINYDLQAFSVDIPFCLSFSRPAGAFFFIEGRSPQTPCCRFAPNPISSPDIFVRMKELRRSSYPPRPLLHLLFFASAPDGPSVGPSKSKKALNASDGPLFGPSASEPLKNLLKCLSLKEKKCHPSSELHPPAEIR